MVLGSRKLQPMVPMRLSSTSEAQQDLLFTMSDKNFYKSDFCSNYFISCRITNNSFKAMCVRIHNHTFASLDFRNTYNCLFFSFFGSQRCSKY